MQPHNKIKYNTVQFGKIKTLTLKIKRIFYKEKCYLIEVSDPDLHLCQNVNI